MHTGGCVLLKISCSVCPARARSSFPVFGSATLFATCVCWPSNTGYWPSLGWRSGNADSSRDRAVIDSWTRAFTFSFEINFLIRVFQNFCFQLLFPPPWLFLFGVFYLWTIFSYLLLIFSYLLLLLSIIFWKLFVSIPLIVFFFWHIFFRNFYLDLYLFSISRFMDICFEIVSRVSFFIRTKIIF